MERRARKFRSAAAALLGSKARRGSCYPEPLRRLAVEAAQAAQRSGLGTAAVAQQLGVHADTLRKWLAASESTAFVPVRVIELPQVKVAKLVVFGPAGLRIEGLELAEVAELVRRLA